MNYATQRKEFLEDLRRKLIRQAMVDLAKRLFDEETPQTLLSGGYRNGDVLIKLKLGEDLVGFIICGRVPEIHIVTERAKALRALSDPTRVELHEASRAIYV